MHSPSSILRVLVFAGAVGLATVAFALPPEVTVTASAQLEIMRGSQVSGRISLVVGATLEVENVEGEFVLVRYRGVKGRVLAKHTDLAARDPAAPPPETAEPAQVSAPPPALPQPEKPAVSKSPTPARTVEAKPAATTTARVEPDNDKTGWALMVGMLVGFLVMIVAHWRLFTKAGKPGWAILVPIYNLIVWQQISGKPLWWVLLYLVPVANLVVGVLTVFGVASNFGKGKAFGVGLLLAPYFFVPMLAFGDAQYIGVRS